MKISRDRAAFCGILGESIDIYQVQRAVAAAYVKLGGYSSPRNERCKVVVGHDASPAADMMTSAVCAAVCAAGANVISLGLVPSGAVSSLTPVCNAVMGIMITGSRCNYEISGLKFYQKDGRQVSGELLESIQASIDGSSSLGSRQSGRILPDDPSLLGCYRRNLIEASGFTMFEKLKVAVDCMDSACAPFAEYVIKQLGADVEVMERGTECGVSSGSSYENPSLLIEFVRDTDSDIGFTFSADGEMCIAALPDGKLLDSERLAEIFGRVYGKALKNEETTPVIMLSDNCHIALAPYIKSMGAEVKSVTGDYSYLAEEYAGFDNVIMAADRLNGIIFPRRSLVPDGLLTSVMLLSCMNRMGMTIGELWAEVPKLIRGSTSVVVPSGAFIPVMRTTDLQEEIRVLRSYLSGDGRVMMYRPDSSRVEIIVEGIKTGQVSEVLDKAETLIRNNLRIAEEAEDLRRPETSAAAAKPADSQGSQGDPDGGVQYQNVKKES